MFIVILHGLVGINYNYVCVCLHKNLQHLLQTEKFLPIKLFYQHTRVKRQQTAGKQQCRYVVKNNTYIHTDTYITLRAHTLTHIIVTGLDKSWL